MNDLFTRDPLSMHIDSPDFGHTLRIVPVEQESDGVAVYHPEEGGAFHRIFIKRGEVIPNNLPFLEIPKVWAEKMRDALDEYLSPKGPTPTERELDAVRYHLEDMRTLVLSPKTINIKE